MSVRTVNYIPQFWEPDPTERAVVFSGLTTAATFSIIQTLGNALGNCPPVTELTSPLMISAIISSTKTILTLPNNEDAISCQNMVKSAAKLGCLLGAGLFLSTWEGYP
jgi:hypothetical protein